MLAALERLGEPGEGPGRVLLSTVRPIAEELAAALREHPAANRVEVAGSARRWAETCKDIDLIATAEEPAALAEHLAGHALIAAAGNPGPNGVRAQTHNGISVDLRIVAPEAFGNLLQHFTGSAGAQRAAARRGGGARPLGLRARHHRDRERRDDALRERGGGLRAARLRLHRAGAARGARRAEGGARRQAAGAGRGRRHPRRPALPHDPLRRPQHARGDGRGGARARLRLHGDHRPLGQPRLRRPRHRRAALGADRGGRAPGTRASAASACSPARRSTSASTARSTTPTTWSRRSTGSSPASTPPSRSPRRR